MNLVEINEVIKASPAIQIQGKITHLQPRIYNAERGMSYSPTLTTIYRTSKYIASASSSSLRSLVSIAKTKNISKKHCARFAIVESNGISCVRTKSKNGVLRGLLAEARIVNGICYYEYSHTMRQKLHNPRIYTKLNLRLQNRFKSQYALILWEVCFDYFDNDRSQGETPYIPLETFRELMGIEADEYSGFPFLNRDVIKPAIREINDVTDYYVEVEQKRLGRKISELKFRITRVKTLPVPESVFPDIENLPPVAIELVQAGIDRKVALKIADVEWDFVRPSKLPVPGSYADFLEYVAEKIEMSLDAEAVKNRAGYIVEAVRENYQDPEIQKRREVRAEAAKKKALEDLEAEFTAKRNTLIRQAIHADPQLVDLAAERIHSYIVRQRLDRHPTAMKAYQQGGMVTAEINAILAEEFCQELLAPVVEAYEDETARILKQP